MRDRNLGPTAVVAAIVCCGSMALIAGLVGGVALVSIGRLTAVSVGLLGVVVAIAWGFDRRRHHRRTADRNDRPAHGDGAAR